MQPDLSEGTGCRYAVIEHQRRGPECQSHVMYERTALGEQIVPRRDAEAETGRRTSIARLHHEPTEQQPCRRESGVEPWPPTQRFAKRPGKKSAVVQQHE